MGDYFDTIPNASGCDSIIKIGLLSSETHGRLDMSFCEAYVSPSGKHKWTTSGTYTDTIPNTVGCDSIITIHLIDQKSYATLDTTICGIFTSPSSKYLWTATGVYTDTIPNHKGCDSVITINLKSLNTDSLITVSACDSFESLSGRNTWTLSGTYIETFKNNVGCDSIVTYEVTINRKMFKIINIEPYETGPTGKSWEYEGMYMDTIQTTKGCDSIFLIFVERMIHYDPILTAYDTVCTEHVSRNGNIYDSSGIYYIDKRGGLLNYLHLTLNHPDTSVTQTGSILRANMDSASYQWLNCDQGLTPIPGANRQSFAPAQRGRYALAINNKGCLDTSGCHRVLLPGLYPNPTSGPIIIDLGVEHQNINTTVYDALGKVISEHQHGSAVVFGIDIHGARGVYMVEVHSEQSPLRIYKVVKNED